LAAVEGAILLVDASKGIQAQTLANFHLAQAQNLKIIPVINKIDLPNARTAQVKEELSYLLGVEPEEILEISAKTGQGVEKVLRRIIEVVPPPISYNLKPAPQLKALIFDSTFDAYKGVVAFVRVFSGSFKNTCTNFSLRFIKLILELISSKTPFLLLALTSPLELISHIQHFLDPCSLH